MIPARTYGVLVEAFVEDRLTAEEFKTLFVQLFKLDPGGRPQKDYDQLASLFAAAESFVDDPEERRPDLGEIGEPELRGAAVAAAARLFASEDEGR